MMFLLLFLLLDFILFIYLQNVPEFTHYKDAVKEEVRTDKIHSIEWHLEDNKEADVIYCEDLKHL